MVLQVMTNEANVHCLVLLLKPNQRAQLSATLQTERVAVQRSSLARVIQVAGGGAGVCQPACGGPVLNHCVVYL